MSAVGHYLEQAGIPTAGISLVREHSAAMRPPRALWVPFPLGRPLGAPGEPAFQRDVLRALLGLFEQSGGPVLLRDFPHDAPAGAAGEDDGPDACPVGFSRPDVAGDDDTARAQALRDEIDRLRSWYDLAVRRRGGSTLALSGLSPEAAGEFIAAIARGGRNADDDAAARAERLKHACEDLRAYYEEAAGAQPGALSPGAMRRWFYLRTHAGETIRAARRAALADDDPALRAIAERALVPRAILLEAGD